MYYYYDYYFSNISIQRCVLWFIYFFLCTPFLAPSANPVARSSQVDSIPHPILAKQQAYYLNLTGVSKNRGGIYPQIIHGCLLGFSILFTINHPFWGKLPPIFGKNLIENSGSVGYGLFHHPPVRRRVGAKNCGQSAVQLLGIGRNGDVKLGGWIFFREPRLDMGEIPPKMVRLPIRFPYLLGFFRAGFFFWSWIFFWRGGLV